MAVSNGTKSNNAKKQSVKKNYYLETKSTL